jgi:Icc-related predicted phosphoesterase
VTVRIAAVGDVHVGTDSAGRLAESFSTLDGCADMLLLAGDLTRIGSPDEAACLVRELEDVTIPTVAVLGNHDLHSDQGDALTSRLEAGGVTVLDGTSTVVDVNGITVGVAGVRGFGGGFAGRSASDFGEPEMKAFIRTTIRSAEQLQQALTELHTDLRIALLHYSPVPETLVGEPPEIFPFLGSYLLAEAIDRAGADLVLHGHAHRGRERGLTPGGVRVRNVAQPVIGAPFRVYELTPVTALAGEPAQRSSM